MPKATVTPDNGLTPVIPASGTRTVLILQNNSLFDVRYRFYGEVSFDVDLKSGILLSGAIEAGRPGGMVMLTGALAQRPVYALHTGSAEDVVKLDYESDA